MQDGLWFTVCQVTVLKLLKELVKVIDYVPKQTTQKYSTCVINILNIQNVSGSIESLTLLFATENGCNVLQIHLQKWVSVSF